MVQKMAPVFENLKGNFSGNMDIRTELDPTMSPVMETMKGGGKPHNTGHQPQRGEGD